VSTAIKEPNAACNWILSSLRNDLLLVPFVYHPEWFSSQQQTWILEELNTYTSHGEKKKKCNCLNDRHGRISVDQSF